jgi:hypothetical protein
MATSTPISTSESRDEPPDARAASIIERTASLEACAARIAFSSFSFLPCGLLRGAAVDSACLWQELGPSPPAEFEVPARTRPRR